MAALSSPNSSNSCSSTFTSYSSPCAACKFLRRKCMSGCIFAPYFPPEDARKFVSVHRIFGASNVAKFLKELLPQHREDAVNSIVYEAEARVRDPVYGCVGAISLLQNQVVTLQKELDEANADLVRYVYSRIIPAGLPIVAVQPPLAMAVRPVMANHGSVGQGSDSPAAFYNNKSSGN